MLNPYLYSPARQKGRERVLWMGTEYEQAFFFKIELAIINRKQVMYLCGTFLVSFLPQSQALRLSRKWILVTAGLMKHLGLFGCVLAHSQTLSGTKL